jgi:DNA-binding IclR family transcriptional regulator
MTKTSDREKETQTLNTVTTAFKIVEQLEERESLRVKELAEFLDASRSKAYIYLNTLRELGFVVKHDNSYRLSYRWLEKGGIVRRQRELFDISVSEVDKLADQTGELANLGTEENGQRVLVYNSKGDDAVSDETSIGEHTYMHWSALGKVILASLSEERVRKILEQHGLPAATENTICDESELFEELDRIDEQGYALEDEEREYSMRAVAVAIISKSGNPIGSLSISGPKDRFHENRIKEDIVPNLNSAASAIELLYNNL